MNHLRNLASSVLLHSPLKPRSWEACLRIHWPILQHALQDNPYGQTLALQCLSDMDSNHITGRTFSRLLKLKAICRKSSAEADQALFCFLHALYQEHLGQTDGMEKSLLAACRLGHSYHTIHAMLGTHDLFDSGLFSRAADSFDAAISCIYQYPPLDDAKLRLVAILQTHRAHALVMMHQPEEAEALLLHADKAAGEPSYLHALAMLRALQGRAEEAQQALTALRSQREALADYAEAHVKLLLEGMHPHFTAIPTAPHKLRRYWNTFQEREGDLLALLKGENGPHACFNEQRDAFLCLCPAAEHIDRMNLRFAWQDGKARMYLSDLHSRTCAALIDELIAACPPGIASRWEILHCHGDPEPLEAAPHAASLSLTRPSLRERLRSGLCSLVLRTPLARRHWAQHLSMHMPILGPAFAQEPYGRLLTLRVLDALQACKPARAWNLLSRLNTLTRSGPDEDRALFYFLLGLHSEACGRQEEMARSFRPAIRRGAAHPYIHARLGEHYLLNQHRYDDAYDQIMLAIHRTEPYGALAGSKTAALCEYRACLAIILLLMHRTEEAESMLNAAHAVRDTDAYRHAAILQYAIRGQEEAAMAACRELQRTNPGLCKDVEPGMHMLLNGTHPHFTAKVPDPRAIAAYWEWFVSNEPQLREALASKDDNAFKRWEKPHFDLLCPEPSNIDVMFRRIRMVEGRPTITLDDNYSRNYAALIDALIAACPPEVTEHWTIDRIERHRP